MIPKAPNTLQSSDINRPSMKPKSPRYRCSVCGSTTNMVFTYPRDPIVRNEWARILRTTWRRTVHLDWICGNHFSDDDFSNHFKNRLKPNVYPLAPSHQFVRAPTSLSPWGPVRLPTKATSYEYTTSALDPVTGEDFADDGQPDELLENDEETVSEYDSPKRQQIKLRFPIRQVTDRRAFVSDTKLVALVEPRASDEVDAGVGTDHDLEFPWTKWRNVSNDAKEGSGAEADTMKQNRRLGNRLKIIFFKWKNKGNVERIVNKPAQVSRDLEVGVERTKVKESPGATNGLSLSFIQDEDTPWSLTEDEIHALENLNRTTDENRNVTGNAGGSFAIRPDTLRQLGLSGKSPPGVGNKPELSTRRDQMWAIQHDMDLMKIATRKSHRSNSPNERIASFVYPVVQGSNQGAYPKHSGAQPQVRTNEVETESRDRKWLGEHCKI